MKFAIIAVVSVALAFLSLGLSVGQFLGRIAAREQFTCGPSAADKLLECGTGGRPGVTVIDSCGERCTRIRCEEVP